METFFYNKIKFIMMVVMVFFIAMLMPTVPVMALKKGRRG